MSESKTYNGWTNYETWNVALWIGNEEGSERYWREAAQECYAAAEADRTFTRDERAALTLADRLKGEFEEANPITEASVWADLMGAALSEVNWHEIAENYIEEADKTDAEDEDA